MTNSEKIDDVQTAVTALRDKRLMMRDGVYLVGGRDVVVAQGTFETMLREGLIQRVGGMYELTIKGKQMARNGGQHASLSASG